MNEDGTGETGKAGTGRGPWLLKFLGDADGQPLLDENGAPRFDEVPLTEEALLAEEAEARARGWVPSDEEPEDDLDPAAEEEADRAFSEFPTLWKGYREGTISRSDLVGRALAGGAHFDLITRSSLYDFLEFHAKEHFCELWAEDHDCVVRGAFTTLQRPQARQAWLDANKDVLAQIRAELAAMPADERRAVCALFSKADTQDEGLKKLDA